MNNESLIFSNRFEQPIYDELIDTYNGNSNENEATNADDFLESIRKNRRIVPNPERLANKDMFVNAVRQLSEEYEIDADLKEIDSGYNAIFYMYCASYSGYIKKLLNVIVTLADEYSVHIDPDKKNCDYIIIFTYHTHNVYIKGREITDFS